MDFCRLLGAELLHNRFKDFIQHMLRRLVRRESPLREQELLTQRGTVCGTCVHMSVFYFLKAHRAGVSREGRSGE